MKRATNGKIMSSLRSSTMNSSCIGLISKCLFVFDSVFVYHFLTNVVYVYLLGVQRTGVVGGAVAPEVVLCTAGATTTADN